MAHGQGMKSWSSWVLYQGHTSSRWLILYSKWDLADSNELCYSPIPPPCEADLTAVALWSKHIDVPVARWFEKEKDWHIFQFNNILLKCVSKWNSTPKRKLLKTTVIKIKFSTYLLIIFSLLRYSWFSSQT